LIKQKPGFSRKMFWTLEIPFKTGFTVYEDCQLQREEVVKILSGWLDPCMKLPIKHEFIKTGIE
jgi:hypothetical protein